jgi:hypothetical protein
MRDCLEKFLTGGTGFPAWADYRGGRDAHPTSFSCFTGGPQAHEELFRKVPGGSTGFPACADYRGGRGACYGFSEKIKPGKNLSGNSSAFLANGKSQLFRLCSIL